MAVRIPDQVVQPAPNTLRLLLAAAGVILLPASVLGELEAGLEMGRRRPKAERR